MNTKYFYDSIRSPLFAGSISNRQFQGITAILEAAKQFNLTDERKLAYVLATSYHETGKTMQPVQESGRGRNYDYGKKLKRGGGPGKRVPYLLPDQLYYGRGHIQLTWYENYEAMGKITGRDLLNHPELMLDMEISVLVLFKGMIAGYFTGKKLDDYFNTAKTDFVNARKIVNGTDAAVRIAGYATLFYKALKGIQ